jgi:hypothetical protein
MNLPFSEREFLDVFGAYNSALWPAVLALWIITAGVVVRWFLRRRLDGRVAWSLLAIHWAWSGIVYHWLFFRRINPAALLFGALFVAQALLFVWLAMTAKGEVRLEKSSRSLIGVALVAYGLLYPFVGLALALRYPRVPLFAVPCPTTLVTAGLLVASARAPRVVSVIPMIWAAVGASAAFALGIRADLALLAAGASLVFPLFFSRR